MKNFKKVTYKYNKVINNVVVANNYIWDYYKPYSYIYGWQLNTFDCMGIDPPYSQKFMYNFDSPQI